MERRRRVARPRGACGVILAVSLLAGCGGTGVQAAEGGAPSAERAVGAAAVQGTVLDARTGRPVEGAWVVFSGGARTATDASGRFRLRGLPPETRGELEAWTPDGRRGANRLRPLPSGDLEVVVFLRPETKAGGTEERLGGR